MKVHRRSMALFLIAALSFLPGRVRADDRKPAPTAEEKRVDAAARDKARSDGREVARVLANDAKKEAGGDARREVEILKDRATAASMSEGAAPVEAPTEGLSNKVNDTTRSKVDWSGSGSSSSYSSGYSGYSGYGGYYSPYMMGGYGMGGYGMGGYGMGGYGYGSSYGYGGYGSSGGYGSYGSYGRTSSTTSAPTSSAHSDDHAYAMTKDLANKGAGVARDAASKATDPAEKATFEKDAADFDKMSAAASAKLDELEKRPPPPPPPAPSFVASGGGGGFRGPSVGGGVGIDEPASSSPSRPSSSDKSAPPATATKEPKAAAPSDAPAAKPAATVIDKPAEPDNKVQTIAGRLVILRKKSAKAPAAGNASTDDGLPPEAPSRRARPHARAGVKRDVKRDEMATTDAGDVELAAALAKIDQAIAAWRSDDKTAWTDPLTDARGPDGRLDLSKVEVWLVARWRTNEPRRFRIRISPEAASKVLGSDWVNGGTLVARGEVAALSVDDAAKAQLQGEVGELKIDQVFEDALPDNDLPGH